MTLDDYVENPKREKMWEFPDSKHDHYMKEGYNGRLKGNDLELYVFANLRLQQIQLFVSFFLSLSLTMSTVSQFVQK